ncbi:MAG TPA: 7-carboxy-7-deazaguanine synthase QueE [Bacteroidia bacterium]
MMDAAPGFSLPVMETFDSIQGEGFHAGTPAFFIRLGGCDIGCHWCDVKESWDQDAHSILSIDEIVERAKSTSAQKIIVTGGEPLMYTLNTLTEKLKANKFKLHLETSGAYPLSGEWDWICLSPKKNKEPLPEIFTKANELKMIIFNKDDFRFAEKMASVIGHLSSVNLFLQPEWSRRDEMLPQIIEYVKQHPQWRISLQTHKYLGVR